MTTQVIIIITFICGILFIPVLIVLWKLCSLPMYIVRGIRLAFLLALNGRLKDGYVRSDSIKLLPQMCWYKVKECIIEQWWHGWDVEPQIKLQDGKIMKLTLSGWRIKKEIV